MTASDLQASVIVPTKGRPGYLRVALDSLARAGPRAAGLRADRGGRRPVGRDPGRRPSRSRANAARASVYVERAGVPGLNSARNTGIATAGAPLIALVDDDIDAPPGWLRELVEGARRHSQACAFGGPIELRLEGSRLRMCGREQPPITTLDGGPDDREIELVWGANMAFDREALRLAGEFDPGVPYGFDEDMWERRLRGAGGRIFYIARAGLVHRRDRDDARLRALVRESYRRGRKLRAYSEHRGDPPGLASELRVLAGCLLHGPRYRCGNGILLSAHSLGRLRTALSRSERDGEFLTDISNVVSGHSGIVAGRRQRARAAAADLADRPAAPAATGAAAPRSRRRSAPPRVGAGHRRLRAVERGDHGTRWSASWIAAGTS